MVAAHEGGEACVCDLTQPTVSHHLKILVDAGTFNRDKRGVRAYYALRALADVLGEPVPALDVR
jgi:ArsR family transcriptional regulator